MKIIYNNYIYNITVAYQINNKNFQLYAHYFIKLPVFGNTIKYQIIFIKFFMFYLSLNNF